AGTGKTKVITHRIAHLISSKNARPEQILAVTFTEKAANEMEERVDILIPYSYSFVDVSTFNSFGESLLRNYGHEIGLPLDFTLLDEVDQSIFFRENLFQFPLNHYRPLSTPTKHIQELLAAIKRLKQEDIGTQDYIEFADRMRQEAQEDADKETAAKHMEMARVYQAYQKILREQGKIDFEDQVVLAVKLFRDRPSVLRKIQDRYKYILVDEFQDTNYIQFQMLKLLAQKHRNITVVGDDDQSIFRFRGASLSNILDFSKMYPDTQRVVINQNYRSTQAVLDSAYRLIQHNNPYRLEVRENINKSLKAAKKQEGQSIFNLQFDTLSHEADQVAETIEERVQEGFAYKDMAILVRRNADADPFLRSLNMKEIPFRFSGSRGLYSRPEIRLLVSFIRALTDFEDSRSLFRLSISEVYQVSTYDLTQITNYAQKKNWPLHKAFQKISQNQLALDVSSESLKKVKRIFSDLLTFVEFSSSQNAGRVLYSFLERSGYLKLLVEQKDLEAEIKIKNIRLFFDKVRGFSDLTGEDSIQSFAEHLELLQQVGDNPATAEAELEEDAVNVLTVHKAKGLEFPIVFMVSLITDRYPGRMRKEKIPFPDGIIKQRLSGEEALPSTELRKVHMQEERRLFYVGMTRVKECLYLTWGKDYGLKRLKKVSPFVMEALDLTEAPDKTLRASAEEEIRRYAPTTAQPYPVEEGDREGVISLSFFQIDDYLKCPLKYRYRHVMRVPVLPHYNLIYGRVLHDTIHFYLKQKMSGDRLNLEEVIRHYQDIWINEGFLSREHEEMKKKAGEQALRQFYQREEASGKLPDYLEKKFKWKQGGIRFVGRWDRVDRQENKAVITDFKATQVKSQEDADKKARDALQMDLYALSFKKTEMDSHIETRLHFLESDIIGRSSKGDEEMDKAMEKIEQAEQGIRSRDFHAEPDWHNCSYCEFRNICPSSYAY
ncbi:MAG: AAA family ATPase, partial [Candidatus Aminicenantes bacterium]|nr:AAA family ATPase [Candidatus Aminicenantes bacterium]